MRNTKRFYQSLELGVLRLLKLGALWLLEMALEQSALSATTQALGHRS